MNNLFCPCGGILHKLPLPLPTPPYHRKKRTRKKWEKEWRKKNWMKVLSMRLTSAILPPLFECSVCKNRQSYYKVTASHFVTITPLYTKDEEIDRMFHILHNQWRDETKWDSNGLTSNEKYQKIIELGPNVVPSILEQLEKEPDHLVFALSNLCKFNPVPEGCDGDLKSLSSHWVSWGKSNGII